MSHATNILEQARRDAAPPDEHLREARRRRDEVLRAAKSFDGVCSNFVSGSIAHGTANAVNDADAGVILDRRSYPDLGPDGDGVGPKSIVEQVRAYLRDSDLSIVWPDVMFRITNRAIKVFFHEPIAEDVDPTVDLVIGLQRSSIAGLWIPKGMEGSNPTWDASHPQEHTRLFLPDDVDLRRTRVRVTRLAKAANYHSNWRFSSFNVASLAFWGIDEPMNIGEALFAFYDFAVKDMDEHLTPDPAGVSAPIKLPTGTTKTLAGTRLQKQRDLMLAALDADAEDEARESLAKLLPNWVEPPVGKAASVARLLASGAGPSVGATGVVGGSGPGTRPVQKPVRSFGGRL